VVRTKTLLQAFTVKVAAFADPMRAPSANGKLRRLELDRH
jgi:hypothetical protein